LLSQGRCETPDVSVLVRESVSAPHGMDEADPDLVVENLERVIAHAR
jgi:hypothetical protein